MVRYVGTLVGLCLLLHATISLVGLFSALPMFALSNPVNAFVGAYLQEFRQEVNFLIGHIIPNLKLSAAAIDAMSIMAFVFMRIGYPMLDGARISWGRRGLSSALLPVGIVVALVVGLSLLLVVMWAFFYDMATGNLKVPLGVHESKPYVSLAFALFFISCFSLLPLASLAEIVLAGTIFVTASRILVTPLPTMVSSALIIFAMLFLLDGVRMRLRSTNLFELFSPSKRQ